MNWFLREKIFQRLKIDRPPSPSVVDCITGLHKAG